MVALCKKIHCSVKLIHVFESGSGISVALRRKFMCLHSLPDLHSTVVLRKIAHAIEAIIFFILTH